jgi:hypothetical protein
MLLFDQAIADYREGWHPWQYAPPPLNWLHLQTWRREWPAPRTLHFCEMHPLMNVAGLYWRPQGAPHDE